MTPAEFRDAVLAEWKASPDGSMGPALDRVLVRMLEHTEARGFFRGVCAERAACADVTRQRYAAAVIAPDQMPRDLQAASAVALRAVEDLSAAFAAGADVHRVWAGEV